MHARTSRYCVGALHLMLEPRSRAMFRRHDRPTADTPSTRMSLPAHPAVAHRLALGRLAAFGAPSVCSPLAAEVAAHGFAAGRMRGGREGGDSREKRIALVIGTSDAAKEAIWIQSLYSRVLYGQTLYQHADHCPHCLCPDDNSQAQTVEPQEIFVDNQGAIQLAKNPKFHERTKHINVQFHFIRDACERMAIKTTYPPTSDMLADIMTKNLPRETHWKHAHGLGLVCRDTGEASSETEAGGGKRRKRFK